MAVRHGRWRRWASYSLWVDNGLVGYETTSMSSYRGSGNLGYQPTRLSIGAAYTNGTTLLTPSNLLIGKVFATMEDIAFGDANWLAVLRWLGSV